MEPNSNTSSFDEPPVKPARGSLNQQKSQETQRTLSIGYSLNSGANFYDIPASDAFNDLVERYIPPQERAQNDTTDKQNKGLETMVMNNMWRSVAKYARQQIIQTDPLKVEPILRLWHIRLLALVKLGLSQLAAAEFEKLGDLDRPELFDNETQQSLIPFELRILYATLPTYLKYPAITLERITFLAVYCKKMYSKHKDAIWKQRELQTYLVLATHWIYMKDYSAAAATMELLLQKTNNEDIDILSSLGRLYLQMGDIQSANRTFEKLEKNSRGDVAKEAIKANKAFLHIAQGEWSQARNILLQIYEHNNENLVVLNNLAICEIYLGNLIKGIQYFEQLIFDNPTSAGTCETAIMNMCILYELRYEDATEMKIDVMKQVSRWVGDSFQGECIRLQ